MTKLGFHVQGLSGASEYIKACRPRVCVSLDHNPGGWQDVKSATGCFIVGRLYSDWQPLNNPKQNAFDFANSVLPVAEQMRGIYDAWSGYNETGLRNEAAAYNEWTYWYAQKMHEYGHAVVAYNFPVGNPEPDAWAQYTEGLAASDYLGLHEYGGKNLQDGAGYLMLRYRAALRNKPIIITETGIDLGVSGGSGGWQAAGVSEAEYVSMLAWYDSEIAKDGDVIGAAIFTINGGGWGSFEVNGLQSLAQYMSGGVVTLPPANGGSQPPAAGSIVQVPAAILSSWQQTKDWAGKNPLLAAGLALLVLDSLSD